MFDICKNFVLAVDMCHFSFIYQWMRSVLEDRRAVWSHLEHVNVEKEAMGGIGDWVLVLQKFTECSPLSALLPLKWMER